MELPKPSLTMNVVAVIRKLSLQGKISRIKTFTLVHNYKTVASCNGFGFFYESKAYKSKEKVLTDKKDQRVTA